MHGGNQPTDISLIYRRSSRLVSHHPVSLISNQQTIPIDDSDHIRVADTGTKPTLIALAEPNCESPLTPH